MEKIIIDTDPGIDDAMAILFAAKAPSLEIVGLTTVLGNASIEGTTRNALYLVERFGLDAPVYQGAAAPLRLPVEPPPDFVHGKNGMGDVDIKEPTLRPQRQDAADFICEAVRSSPGEVTIVALGRLTNLAIALKRAPDIAGLVKRIVVMGGSLGRGGFGGNVSPVAEANIAGDPDAADIVFQAQWPLVMVGLDVTMNVKITEPFMVRLAEEGGEAGAFLYDATRFYAASYKNRFGYDWFPMHDPTTFAYVVAPHLFETETGALRAVSDGIAMGQTILAPAGSNYPMPGWDGPANKSVCVDVKSSDVLDLFIETLIEGAG